VLDWLGFYCVEQKTGSLPITPSSPDHTQDKTVLSCLVRVGGVNIIGDRSRMSATENIETVLSQNAERTEFRLVSTQFPICN